VIGFWPDIAEFAAKGAVKKSGPAMQMTEPDCSFSFIAWKSVTQEQPQQNDYRDRHTQQP
jgi:hypothetical protein